jgi:pimeloyl-ACP methyl ester carboxylesterase
MASVLRADRSTVSVDHYGPAGRSAWMDIDWRAHQRWVTVAGRAMNVIDIGPGLNASPPTPARGTMVFVHGLSGSWQNWLEQLPVFAAAGWRCVAMDLPGFGWSDMPREKITIPRYAAWLDQLLQALGVSRAVVVGNSMGGFIGLELAITFSTWVDRLVLVSAAGLTIETQRGLFWAVKPVGRALAMTTGWLASRSDELARRRRSRLAMFSIVAAHPEKLPAPLVAEQLRGSGKPGFIDAFDALTDYPIRDRLAEISAPTLVVWGEDDPLVPVRDAWELGRLIPHARVVVYEDTGHVAMLERPDAFNALVSEFADDR